MHSTVQFARVAASFAVLCTATPLVIRESVAQESTKVASSGKTAEIGAQCPVMGPIQDPSNRNTAAGAFSNGDWWPNQLNLQILHQNSLKSNPMGEDFNYAEEFNKLDLAAIEEGHQ